MASGHDMAVTSVNSAAVVTCSRASQLTSWNSTERRSPAPTPYLRNCWQMISAGRGEIVVFLRIWLLMGFPCSRGKEGTFSSQNLGDIKRLLDVSCVEVSGILTSIRSHSNTVGVTLTSPSALSHFLLLSSLCFWIMAQNQVDSVLQRPAVVIKNLLSRYQVNHLSWCVYEPFCSHNREYCRHLLLPLFL